MNAPLSIGVFTYSTRPRGSVVHAAALAEALNQLGHEVTLYALAKSTDGFFRPLSCATRLFPAGPAPADPDALIAQRVEEFARGVGGLRPKHDVVHAEDCLAANGLLASGVRIAPLVRTVHHVERYTSPYLTSCQRRSILQADSVLTVSALGRRDVEREYGVPSCTIGNGVDPARFAARSTTALAARKRRWASSPAARFVLSVGGVEPRKNSLKALEAMAPVLASSSSLHWLLAGGSSIWEHDAYRARFAERLAEQPAVVRERIHVLGSVEEQELTELYQLSDVVFFPSTQEGFGLCALEALAAGTPLIASAIEPFTSYLDASCATLVDPNSPPEMTRAILRLLADAELATAQRAAGLGRARDFSWLAVARAHVRFYRALVARASASGAQNSCPAS